MLKYIICILIYIITALAVLEQGEFDVIVTKHEPCKGPKRKNCSKIKTEIQDGIFLAFDMQMLEDMTTIKGKVTGLLNNKELLRLQMKNACDHIFFRALLQMLFYQTDRCGVYKGHYKFRLNIAEMSQKFYGGKFIYGNWSIFSVLYNDNCNLDCNRVHLTIFPKKS